MLKAKILINQEEGIIINIQNLNKYSDPLHLAPMQFCEQPGFYCKTGFLRSHALSLINHICISNKKRLIHQG